MVYYLLLDSERAETTGNRYKWSLGRQILPVSKMRMLQINFEHQSGGAMAYTRGMVVEVLGVGVTSDFISQGQTKAAYQVTILGVIPADVSNSTVVKSYEPYNPNEVTFADKQYVTDLTIALKDTLNQSEPSSTLLPEKFNILLELEE